MAARRPIEGCGPWIATYPAADGSEAFTSCAEDLSAIDPSWVEVLDFVALQAQPKTNREPRPVPTGLGLRAAPVLG